MKRFVAVGMVLAIALMSTGISIAMAQCPSEAHEAKPEIDPDDMEIVEMGELTIGSFGTNEITQGVIHRWTATGAGPTLAVGLLWDERSNDLDLYVIAPDGSKSYSVASGTVTEQCIHTDGTGTWIIDVCGYKVTGSQKYYIGADKSA